MSIDKYILLRYEDYERLISNHPNIEMQIDKKTLYHSDAGGLTQNAPSVNGDQRAGKSVISASGAGSSGNAPRIKTTAGTIATKAASSPSHAERGGEEVGANWFDVWESLHFSR